MATVEREFPGFRYARPDMIQFGEVLYTQPQKEGDSVDTSHGYVVLAKMTKRQAKAFRAYHDGAENWACVEIGRSSYQKMDVLHVSDQTYWLVRDE